MKGNISEIFCSVQGEGKYAGVNQVFVRFFECNMHCVWCDTPHSIGDTTRHYREFTVDELMREIDREWINCHSISLTGGEPLLQKNFIKDLLPELKKTGKRIYLETNGIYHEPLSELISDIDIIAMDLKLPSSTQCRSYWDEHREFIKVARQKEVFIKTVISSATTQEDVQRSIDLVADIDPKIPYILQPNYFDRHNGVMGKCLGYQGQYTNRLNDIRIIPQMHKMMKVR